MDTSDSSHSPVIDVHCHTTPRAVVAELKRLAESTSPRAAAAQEAFRSQSLTDDPQMGGALDERVPIMDEAGIDMQLVSSANPVSRFFADDVGAIRAVCEASNEELSAACLRHPDRYRFFASLPLPHVEPAVHEFQRALRLPGCVGTVIHTNFGLPLNHPSMDDLYREVARADGLIFIHPSRMDNPGRYGALGVESMIAWPSEDTLALMELVLGGVFDRFPELTVIAPHCSGTALFLLGRIDYSFERMPKADRRAAYAPSYYVKRMYHDTVTSWRPALELARSVVGADHLVLGSDFPYWYRQQLGHCLRVVNGLHWSEEEMKLVRGGNAFRLLQERSLDRIGGARV